MKTASLAVALACVLACAGSAQSVTDPRPALSRSDTAVAAPEAPPVDPAEGAASPAPEPGSLLLVGTGLIVLALSSRRWRRALMTSS